VIYITFVFFADLYSFQRLAGPIRPAVAAFSDVMLNAALPFTVPAERNCMGFHTIAGAAFRALTARKDGPSLYDVCDPVLLKYRGGDPHLGKFYRTALGNPALRPLLRRTGLPALRDEKRLGALQEALRRARDEAEPDWAAVGAPIAELMADIGVNHPSPQPVAAAWPGA
jgi:hypothetical protein